MIVSLQYLRGIAAMMVVTFHACDLLGKIGGETVRFTVGLAGVDIFFVISGFIMWVMAERTGPTPAEFMRKRIIRVAPLYWLLTSTIAAVALAMPGLLSTSILEPTHLAASLLFFPWPHPRIDALLPLLIPGWTLNYEMAFYALFATSLLLPKPARLGYLLALLAFAAILGLFLREGGAAGFYTKPIILEFAAGIVVAEFWRTGTTLRGREAVLVMLAGFLLLWLGAGSALPRIVSLGVPSLMIVSGAVLLEGRLQTRPVKSLMLLGDASYSIYLSHVLVLPVAARLWTFAGPVDGKVDEAAFLAFALAFAVTAGIALYMAVERPLLRWMSARPARKPLSRQTSRPLPGE